MMGFLTASFVTLLELGSLETGALAGALIGIALWWSLRQPGARVEKLSLVQAQALVDGRRVGSFDPITGLWGEGDYLGDLSAPYSPTVERLRAGAAPDEVRAARQARPTGTAPATCPHCDQALDLEDAEPEAAWFCYHCGGDLVDMGGAYLEAEEQVGGPVDPDRDPDDQAPPRRRDRA
jgi:hypothetical protein